MTTMAEYREWWKFTLVKPCPALSEKCECGMRIVRKMGSTMTCGKCGHTVLSYNKIQFS